MVTSKGFSFRQRFEMAPGGRLPFDQDSVVLLESGDVRVELRSLEEKPLKESALLAIWGSGYESERSAREAGEQWRGGIQKALAAVGLGANFGLRNPSMGGFSDPVLEEIRRETGTPVYRDSWDVLVFPSELMPRFSSMSGTGQLLPAERTMSAALSACVGGEPTNEVAFDLLTASMRSAHIADARVVLLVMAFECLIQRRERPRASVEYLDELVQRTSTNEALEASEREALSNALRNLRRESSAKAARALAHQLDARSYSDDPAALIVEAFKMRHTLVHGGRRPELERVRTVGANLERMVGELIAGTTVAQAVAT